MGRVITISSSLHGVALRGTGSGSVVPSYFVEDTVKYMLNITCRIAVNINIIIDT